MSSHTQIRPPARPGPQQADGPVSGLTTSNSDAQAEIAGVGSSDTPFLDALGPRNHVIQRGDTLTSIARAYGVSVAELVEANGIRDPNRIQVGTTLVIPSTGPLPEPVVAPVAVDSGGGVGRASEAPPPRPRTRTWVVRSGDSLWALSRRFGVTVDDLVRTNGLRSPDRIRVGQVLTIPIGSPAQEAPAPVEEAPAPVEEAPAPVEEAPAPDQEQEEAPAADQEQEEVPASELDAALAPAVEAVLAEVPADQLTYAESSVPKILRTCVQRNARLVDQAAYILATAEHESRFGKPMYRRSESLVEDNNRYTQQDDGTWSARVHTNGLTVTADTEEELDVAYWDSAYGGRLENEPETADAANFRGRGFVQLTGRTNYERMTERLNLDGFEYTLDGQTWGGDAGPIDLLANPDHVNRSEELAAEILVLGCMEGLFTGRSLGDYIDEGGTDFYDARAVVNGDKVKNGHAIGETAQRYSEALEPHWAALFPVT